ncbi:hypothetical protein L596_022025 [Steinernema carpocapsae]|uniref:Uncharacterized protein n=1 Tax=Steinernema carpocapsae TaxID=34508 RepID=A0A4U5MKL7_STECR|nr:hypothetical protein L596_022025 [Steinernema carpocapsae]
MRQLSQKAGFKRLKSPKSVEGHFTFGSCCRPVAPMRSLLFAFTIAASLEIALASIHCLLYTDQPNKSTARTRISASSLPTSSTTKPRTSAPVAAINISARYAVRDDTSYIDFPTSSGEKQGTRRVHCGHPGRVFHPLKLLNSGNGQIFVCLIGTCTSGRTTVDEIMAQKRSSTTRIGSSWAEAVRELLKPSSGSDVTTELIWTASIRPSMIPTGNFC